MIDNIISEEAVIDVQTLPQVRMPRREEYGLHDTCTLDTRHGFQIEPDPVNVADVIRWHPFR